ncbi:hypothetical protein GF391_02490 [Candidatus Uhrbacteria bacterium]|nr:hypothetical protein [Candidatus Uhrbacteria bacterium]
MPSKKTTKSSKSSATKASAEAKSAPKNSKQMGMVFIIFILFVSLIIISLALYRVSSEQERLLGVVNSLSDEVSQQQIVAIPDDSDEIKVQYKDSDVAGLRLAYTPCPPTFTGPCDNLMVYRLNNNGSKEVLVPATRNLAGAPLTSELLQPIAANKDFTRLAFGAWAYGGKRNPTDGRVWIVETADGTVIAQASNVFDGAVFSPDMSYAAYYNLSEDDEEQVMVIDINEDEEFLAAQAADGITYQDASGKVTINWLNEDTLAVIQYEIEQEGGEPQIIGEREITIN